MDDYESDVAMAENEAAAGGMGGRIKDRMHELGMRPSELAAKVIARSVELGLPPPQPRSIYATIARNSAGSEWSDLIAEALAVNHRWLQCGLEPKERGGDWPFPQINEAKLRALPFRQRFRLQRQLLMAAKFFGIDLALAIAIAVCLALVFGGGDRIIRSAVASHPGLHAVMHAAHMTCVCEHENQEP